MYPGTFDCLMVSMGPRPRGRGVRPLNRPSTFPTSCFNGAAPARARSWRCASPNSDAKTLLQWGRARAGAELPTILYLPV